MFGEVERAVHFADEKGRPVGEGIVEFSRRPGAQDAIKRITEGVFILTAYVSGKTEPLLSIEWRCRFFFLAIQSLL